MNDRFAPEADCASTGAAKRLLFQPAEFIK
jgi:hypothetical protein